MKMSRKETIMKHTVQYTLSFQTLLGGETRRYYLAGFQNKQAIELIYSTAEQRMI